MEQDDGTAPEQPEAAVRDRQGVESWPRFRRLHAGRQGGALGLGYEKVELGRHAKRGGYVCV